jgi:hypothetical protein
VAAVLGAATHQDVEYVAESFESARTRLRGEGLPDWLIGSRLALAEYQRAEGKTARVTRDVFEVTGHPPRSLAQFAYDNQEAFTLSSENVPSRRDAMASSGV